MKISTTETVALAQLNVVAGVNIGAQGTTGISDKEAALTYYPSIGIVLVEKQNRRAVIVPLSNVRSMEVNNPAPAQPQVKK